LRFVATRTRIDPWLGFPIRILFVFLSLACWHIVGFELRFGLAFLIFLWFSCDSFSYIWFAFVVLSFSSLARSPARLKPASASSSFSSTSHPLNLYRLLSSLPSFLNLYEIVLNIMNFLAALLVLCTLISFIASSLALPSFAKLGEYLTKFEEATARHPFYTKAGLVAGGAAILGATIGLTTSSGSDYDSDSKKRD